MAATSGSAGPSRKGQTAGLGARVLAFLVDAVMCALISYGFARTTSWTTLVFAVEVFVLTASLGASAGQLITGMRVVRVGDGGPPGPVKALVRTVLLLLLVPALIWDSEGRGLHDKAAGTRLIHVR